MDDTAEVLIRFKGDSSSAEKAQDQLQKKLEQTQKVAQVAFTAIVGYVDKMVASFVNAGIEYNASMETFMTRLTTLTGAEEEADKILQQIKEDALTTPFDVASLTQAESLLLSTGLSADQARNDILALGDAISASGGGNEELQRMAVNLQQIKNVGKASALDIKQFAYAGIDIYGLLADSLNITREEASKMPVTYDMLSAALQKASSEGGKYYQAMEKQSKTYKGAMSNLEESVNVFKGTMSEGLFETVKNLIPKLTDLLNWLAKNKDAVLAIILPILTFVNVLVGWLAISKIIALLGALWGVLMANPIMLIVGLILAVSVGLAYLWTHCEKFRNFILNTLDQMKQIAIDTWNFFKGIFASIGERLKIIPEHIKSIFNSLPESMKQIGKNIVNGLWNGIKGMKDWVVNKVKDLGGSILKGIKGVLGIKSPSKEFALIGKFSVLGYTEALDDMSRDVEKQVGETFGISPQLANTSALNYTPNVQVFNNISMKQDPLGQMVNDIKTFSGGSKNDYNYGMGV